MTWLESKIEWKIYETENGKILVFRRPQIVRLPEKTVFVYKIIKRKDKFNLLTLGGFIEISRATPVEVFSKKVEEILKEFGINAYFVKEV